MTGLAEDSWVLLAASAFNLLQYAVLVKGHKENQASQKYVNEKRSIFIVSSDNYRYFLIVHQKKGRFLKVSCNVESEAIQINLHQLHYDLLDIA